MQVLFFLLFHSFLPGVKTEKTLHLNADFVAFAPRLPHFFALQTCTTKAKQGETGKKAQKTVFLTTNALHITDLLVKIYDTQVF